MAGLSPEGKQSWSTKMPQLVWSPTADLLGAGPTDTTDLDKMKNSAMLEKLAPRLLSQSHCQENVLFPKENGHTAASFPLLTAPPTCTCTRLRYSTQKGGHNGALQACPQNLPVCQICMSPHPRQGPQLSMRTSQESSTPRVPLHTEEYVCLSHCKSWGLGQAPIYSHSKALIPRA